MFDRRSIRRTLGRRGRSVVEADGTRPYELSIGFVRAMKWLFIDANIEECRSCEHQLMLQDEKMSSASNNFNLIQFSLAQFRLVEFSLAFDP